MQHLDKLDVGGVWEGVDIGGVVGRGLRSVSMGDRHPWSVL